MAIHVFVDSVDDGYARILMGDDEDIDAVVPCDWLPARAGEGDSLQMHFTFDDEATKRSKKMVKDLMEGMTDNP